MQCLDIRLQQGRMRLNQSPRSAAQPFLERVSINFTALNSLVAESELVSQRRHLSQAVNVVRNQRPRSSVLVH
jgi:hypothetical protein